MRAVTFLAALGLAALSGGAEAGDVKVIATAAWPTVLKEITPIFEAETGDHIVVQYGGPADVSRRVSGGEAFDVVLSSAAALKDFAARRLVLDAKALGVAHTVLVYPKGRPPLDASTPAAVADIVRSAQRIAYTDPATGASTGIFFTDIVKSQGLEGELARKALIVPPAAGGLPVNEGKADVGVALSCEVAELHNVQAVRLAPNDPRDTTAFAYGEAAQSSNPQGARKLMDFIASERMARVMGENGFSKE